MITVIDCDNKHLYREQLAEHHRIRHEIYVEDRRWMALERPDGREVDQFDNDDAVYLLALDEGRVIGGTRLIPTLKPHLMADVFPYLANVEGIQRGPDLVEWTRIFVIRRCAALAARSCTPCWPACWNTACTRRSRPSPWSWKPGGCRVSASSAGRSRRWACRR